jgi:hypothetical protein
VGLAAYHSSMFERLTTPAEPLTYELGSALAMEDILPHMLGELELEPTSDDIVDLLRRHAAAAESDDLLAQLPAEIRDVLVSGSS